MRVDKIGRAVDRVQVPGDIAVLAGCGKLLAYNGVMRKGGEDRSAKKTLCFGIPFGHQVLMSCLLVNVAKFKMNPTEHISRLKYKCARQFKTFHIQPSFFAILGAV